MGRMTLADQERAGAEAVESEGGKDELGKAMESVLPWGISALIHTSLVLMSIWLVWTQVQSSQEEPLIVSTGLGYTENPGGLLGGSSTASRLAGGSTHGSRPSIGGIRQTTQSGVGGTGSMGGGPEGKGIGGRVGGKGSVIGVLGPGTGGGGDGTGGKFSPFGNGPDEGGDGIGIFSPVVGTQGTNAKRIAYLIDASGSLIDTLPFVVAELKRSINELNEKQSFTVVFFQGDKAIEAPPAGLKQATAQNKRNVLQWIDPRSGNVTPKGRSDPIPALKQVLGYKPQLLFILSDNITGLGQWETNQDSLVAAVQHANVGGTRINTIQFLYDDPLAKLGKHRTLELVADRTGGRFRFVDARALGLE